MTIRRLLLCPILMILSGCSSDTGLAPAPQVVADQLSYSFVNLPVPISPLVALDIPTYEHSSQAVHPDVLHFAAAWHGWEYWMAMTPFPAGKEAFENPSILVSHDGRRWQVPDGLVNPLAPTPRKAGYNSDPDLSYDANADRLLLVYREVTATDNIIHSTVSSDGIKWAPPRVLFQRKNHGIVSPAVTVNSTGAAVWYVNAGPRKCSERVTHVMVQNAEAISAAFPVAQDRGWSAPRLSGLVQPGFNIWHLDVSWIAERGEYWATYVAYPGKACWAQDLYFARSSDGEHWTTYAIPFLQHGDAVWTANTLYRASVLYDASRDVIQFYVSGASAKLNWKLGYVEFQLTPFLQALESGRATLVSAPAVRGPLQEDTDEP